MMLGQPTTIEDVEKHNEGIDGLKDTCKHGLYQVHEFTPDFVVMECMVCHKWATLTD